MPLGGAPLVKVWLPQAFVVVTGAGGLTGAGIMVTVFELQVDQAPLEYFAFR